MYTAGKKTVYEPRLFFTGVNMFTLKFSEEKVGEITSAFYEHRRSGCDFYTYLNVGGERLLLNHARSNAEFIESVESLPQIKEKCSYKIERNVVLGKLKG